MVNNVTTIAYIVIALVVAAPNAFLSLGVNLDADTHITLPYGQYFLFFGCIASLAFFHFKPIFGLNILPTLKKIIIKHRVLSALTVAILLAAFFGPRWVESFRLFTIIALLSVVYIYLGRVFVEIAQVKPWLPLIILGMPFLPAVALSVLIHMLDLIGLEIGLSQAAHSGYVIERWHTAYRYANEFGINAAILAVVSCFAFADINSRVSRATQGVILMVILAAGFATIMSGTRTAFVFAILCFFMLPFIWPSKAMKRIVTFSVFLSLILAFANWETLSAFLRLGSDTAHDISSFRTGGWFILIGAFEAYPLTGMGFGAVDGGISTDLPLNMMYLGLLAELGIFGGAALTLMLLYPFMIFAFEWIKRPNIGLELNAFELFSVLAGTALLAIQVFEFNIARVSSYHLFFMVTWSATLHILDKIRKHDNAINT